MAFPKIDISALPGLDSVTGMFGSIVDGGPYNDKILAIMVYVYDAAPPPEALM